MSAEMMYCGVVKETELLETKKQKIKYNAVSIESDSHFVRVYSDFLMNQQFKIGDKVAVFKNGEYESIAIRNSKEGDVAVKELKKEIKELDF